MNSSVTPKAVASQIPLPTPQFKKFITVFHVVFIGGLLFCLTMRWRRSSIVSSWEDIALLALVGMQIALYFRFLVFPWKSPASSSWWGVYFAASYVIWFAEWQLEKGLEWTAWAYLGQMFGVLPARVSIPGGGTVFLVYFGCKFGWDRFFVLNPWEWFGGLALMTSVTALGLFIRHLTVTGDERALLIQELQAAQKQLELANQRNAELAVLRERERLARELHDSLGHGLVTLTVQLEAAQRLYPVDPARASALLDGMKELTRNSTEQLRRSLAGLRAPGLGDGRLSHALQTLCTEVSHRAQIGIECQVPDTADSLPPAVAEALWRVAQEGLANLERHAGAKSAQVRLLLEQHRASLLVTDDGVGLPTEAEGKPGHYGLRGLRERVEGLGGEFLASPLIPKGTAVEARIPIA